MGYCVDLEESTVTISKENSIKLMEFLKSYIIDSNPDWRWVNNGYVVNYCVDNNFEELMYELGYAIYETDEPGYSIEYRSSEKLGDDEEIFSLIAPYINDGYIELLGEDGDKWRYVFENGKCETKHPKIEW